MSLPSTYGHRLKNNRHPVRSAKDKLQIDQLVVGWVTTSEYWLLYVFVFFPLPSLRTGRVGDESVPACSLDMSLQQFFV